MAVEDQRQVWSFRTQFDAANIKIYGGESEDYSFSKYTCISKEFIESQAFLKNFGWNREGIGISFEFYDCPAISRDGTFKIFNRDVARVMKEFNHDYCSPDEYDDTDSLLYYITAAIDQWLIVNEFLSKPRCRFQMKCTKDYVSISVSFRLCDADHNEESWRMQKNIIKIFMEALIHGSSNAKTKLENLLQTSNIKDHVHHRVFEMLNHHILKDVQPLQLSFSLANDLPQHRKGQYKQQSAQKHLLEKQTSLQEAPSFPNQFNPDRGNERNYNVPPPGGNKGGKTVYDYIPVVKEVRTVVRGVSRCMSGDVGGVEDVFSGVMSLGSVCGEISRTVSGFQGLFELLSRQK